MLRLRRGGAVARCGNMTQYEVMNMENLMVRNDYWQDNYGAYRVDYEYNEELLSREDDEEEEED